MAAAVCAFLALERYLTPARLESVIVSQLERTFQRPVRVRRVSLVLHQGIRVDDLEVRDSYDPGAGEFLFSEALIIRYKWIALLRGRIELDSVRLTAPRITIVRREDGVWNTAGLLRRGEADSGVSSLPPLQSADEIRIEKGSLRVEDRSRGSSFALSGLHASVDGFGMERPFPVELGFRSENVVAGRAMNADFDLSGVVSLAGLRRTEAYVAAKRLRVRMGAQVLELSGSLRDLDSPRVDLKVQTPRVTSELLSSFFAAPGGIDIPPGTFRFKVHAEGAGAGWTGRAWRIEQAEAESGGMRARAQGSSELSASGKRRIRASVSSQGLDLAQLAACWTPWAERSLRGGLSGSFGISGTVSSPTIGALALRLSDFSVRLSSSQSFEGKELSLKGEPKSDVLAFSLQGGRYSVLGNVFSGLRLKAELRKGDLRIQELESDWRESHASVSGCVRNLRDPQTLVFDAQVDRLRVDQLYDDIMGTVRKHREEIGRPASRRPWAQVFKYSLPKRLPDLRGRIRVRQAYSANFDTQSLELVFDLRGIGRGLRSASGEFRIGFGPGRVNNVQDVRAAHRVLNVLLLPFTYMHEMNAKAVLSLQTATPKTLDFNRNYGDFSVRDGVVDVRLLHSDGMQFVGYADGTVDFAHEKIDSRVMMRLTKQHGQLPDRLVDENGRPSLEIRIADDLNKPAVNMTLRKMSAMDIEDALSSGMKRAAPLDPFHGDLCGR